MLPVLLHIGCIVSKCITDVGRNSYSVFIDIYRNLLYQLNISAQPLYNAWAPKSYIKLRISHIETMLLRCYDLISLARYLSGVYSHHACARLSGSTRTSLLIMLIHFFNSQCTFHCFSNNHIWFLTEVYFQRFYMPLRIWQPCIYLSLKICIYLTKRKNLQ